MTFNTTQLHRERRRGKVIKSAPLRSPTALESELKQALYSTSLSDIQALSGSRSGDVSQRTSSQLRSDSDPVLAYIVSQRLKLGLKTVAMKFPDEAESLNFRASLVASSAPIAGIKDLQMFSKKISNMQPDSKFGRSKAVAIGNEFVYALRKDTTNPAVNFNPYNLYIVSPDIARQYGKHYTVSAFTISEVTCTELHNGYRFTYSYFL